MTKRSSAIASLALALAGVAGAAPAFAQSCGDDMQKLAQRRETEMATINGLVKAANGKQLDPDRVLRQVRRPDFGRKRDDRLHGKEQGLVRDP